MRNIFYRGNSFTSYWICFNICLPPVLLAYFYLNKRWYDSDNDFSLRCNFGCVRRPRDSGVAGRSGPSRVPPSPPTISGFGWSRAIGQNIFGAPIGQPSGSLFSDWWNERGGSGFCWAFFRLTCWGKKKEKTDGKNCNPQNDHCLVTPRYGNVCTHVETYLFCLAYEVYVAVLFRKFRI